MQQAKTLQDIIALKNRMLLTHECIDQFYVRPPSRTFQTIQLFFQTIHHTPQKMLLMAPRGAGKKSLLTFMAKHEQSVFHSIPVKLVGTLNPMDISQVDIIFCLLSSLINDLYQTQKRLDPSVLNRIYQILHDDQLIALIHFKKSEAGDQEGTKIGFVQSFISAIIEALATTGPESRNHIRNSFEPRIRLILKSIQELVDYINRIHAPKKKKLLILFDDLGQLDHIHAENFMQNHLPLTERLCVNMIYTMPDFIRFSSFFPIWSSRMDCVEYFRLLPVRYLDQTECDDGQVFMDTIISKRIDMQLIPEDIKTSIIQMSGGMINHAFQMIIETAIRTLALMPDSKKLEQKALDIVFQYLGRQMMQELSYQEVEMLNQLDLNMPSWAENQTIQSLIRKNILIEYESNHSVCFDIHPLIKGHAHGRFSQ